MRFILCLLALLYTLSPYDLFPDLIIGWGWIDDLAVLGLLWWYQEREQPSGGPHEQESFQKDAYSVLGVGRDTSPEEIKRAFRRLANKYHPDKVSHMGDEFRELAERRFKEIQEAYQKLKVK
ncbi:MAG: DnaJ domain-containing protein [Deltaproteobacteria bacterium]|nr:DnaJ domain-containing protein [Deltaproteobacteria bacterium]